MKRLTKESLSWREFWGRGAEREGHNVTGKYLGTEHFHNDIFVTVLLGFEWLSL